MPADDLRRELAAYTRGMPRAKAEQERGRIVEALIHKAKYGAYGYKLCKNELCKRGPAGGPALVKPPRRAGRILKGVSKEFCSVTCGRNYHKRLQRKRSRGGGWFLETADLGKAERFHRAKPFSKELAEQRYKAHRSGVAKCPAASEATGWYCPGRENGEFLDEEGWRQARGETSYPGRCLILAVFADDLLELTSKHAGRLYVRRWTTNDGRWIEGSEEDPILREAAASPPID